jgi:hypothetical protein
MNLIATTDRRAPHRHDQSESLSYYFNNLPGADYDDDLREGAELKGYTGSSHAAQRKACGRTGAGSPDYTNMKD